MSPKSQGGKLLVHVIQVWHDHTLLTGSRIRCLLMAANAARERSQHGPVQVVCNICLFSFIWIPHIGQLQQFSSPGAVLHSLPLYAWQA